MAEITLVPVREDELELLLSMQREAFADLLAKYQDDDTNPGNEDLDKIRARFSQGWTHYFFIEAEGERVGAIRLVVPDEPTMEKRVSPLFIQPRFRRRGYALAALREAERLYGDTHWSLGTIAQEEGDCRLYEKAGYRLSGSRTEISPIMTIIGYEK